MDVNAIWAPAALRAAKSVVEALSRLGIASDLAADAALRPSRLEQAAVTWDGARNHFRVQLSGDEVAARVAARIEAQPPEEREHFARARAAAPQSLDFDALALDDHGAPIPVLSSDPGALLVARNLTGGTDLRDTLRTIEPLLRPYPEGLFVPGLGVLAANDAYATPSVWRGFAADDYHSPRVVWGREVNLLLLGIGCALLDATGADGRLHDPALAEPARALKRAFDRVYDSVIASGLRDRELWTYAVANRRLVPRRYRKSSDVQLWNLTALAVEHLRDRLAGLRL
jgi:hypothetical protein